MTITYALIQMVGNVHVRVSATPVLTSSCQANSFTSEGSTCGVHTCEQGCIEFAVAITMTLGDLVVVNNDVGDDAHGPEHDRGRQHDRGPV